MRLVEWLARHKARLVSAIGYVTVTVMVITVFIYLTFPWQKLSDWVQGKIERGLSVQISVGESRVRFPLLFIWRDVTVSRFGRNPIRADQISVKWPLGAVLRRKLDLDLSLRVLGGRMDGRLAVRPGESGRTYHFEGSGQGLDLAQLADAFQWPSEGLSGTLLISRIEHHWENQDFLKGEGLAEIEGIGIEHKRWEIRFRRMTGTVTLKGGMSNLDRFSAQGPALDLVGSGSLLLRPNIMDSLLNFNSRVTIRQPTGPLALLKTMASSEGGLDLALRGPLRGPTPYVNGTPFPSIGGLSRPSAPRQQAGRPPARTGLRRPGP